MERIVRPIRCVSAHHVGGGPSRGVAGLSDGGEPGEGYLEAFANVYSDAAEAIESAAVR